MSELISNRYCRAASRVIIAAAIFLLSAPVFGPGVAARSAGQSGDLKSVDAVLDKYVTALGGKEAVRKVTSAVQTGTFEAPEAGLKGTVEAYSKLPNKSLQKITIDGIGVIQQIYDGSKGWYDDPAGGTREIQGEELAQFRRLSDLHRDIKYHEIYEKLTLVGKEKVGGSDAYVIEGVPAQGKPEKLYFDVSTGLLVRQDMTAVSPQGEAPTQTYFEDYRDVGGLKMPFTVRQVTPAITFTVKSTDIKLNIPIDDSKFAIAAK